MIQNEDNEKGLENLVLWQKSIAFATNLCKQVLPMLPPEEKWNMGNQMRRSVQSIPANIAEGHGRYYYQDSIRFCYIARGSLEETFSHLTLARNLNYISEEIYNKYSAEIQELRRILGGYIAFLKKTKRGGVDQGDNLSIKDEGKDTYMIEVEEMGFYEDNKPPSQIDLSPDRLID